VVANHQGSQYQARVIASENDFRMWHKGEVIRCPLPLRLLGLNGTFSNGQSDPKPTMRLSTPSRRANLWADAMAVAISGHTEDSLSDLNGAHFVCVQVAGNKFNSPPLCRYADATAARC
jgi:hypothetical protein